jgi:glycine oxidase
MTQSSLKPGSHDVAVIGGGIIGLSTAWRLAQRGIEVVLVDPEPGRGAAWVAAGMLASASETNFGEEAHATLLAAAAQRWPSFAAELSDATGIDLDFQQAGTLLIGFDQNDAAELTRNAALQRSLGFEVLDLDTTQRRRREPALSPAIVATKFVAGDYHVDPRLVLAALLEVLESMENVAFVRERATRLDIDDHGAQIQLLNGDQLLVARVVVCAGAWTNRIEGLERFGPPPVRPVKGHIVRLFGEPILEHTVRAVVRGRHVYLVQRASGELVIGATAEEKGFDTTIQAGEIFQLLEDARTIVPAIDDLELKETSCGLRPASSDNQPYIGWLEEGRLALATGHYRNGVLLSPITADKIVALIGNESMAPAP